MPLEEGIGERVGISAKSQSKGADSMNLAQVLQALESLAGSLGWRVV